MDVGWQWNPFGKHVRRMKIAGPILERKCICISVRCMVRKKKLKKFENLRNCLKLSKISLLGGGGWGWFTLSTLPST